MADARAADAADAAIDLRPLVVLPGMVDLHVAPAAAARTPASGAGLDLLTWLERYIFPLERAFDAATAERLAPPPSGRSPPPARRPR